MSARRSPALPDRALGHARPASASRTSASAGRIRAMLTALGRRALAALEAHTRRRITLALGERIDELNQAIRAGAEARRQGTSPKEDRT